MIVAWPVMAGRLQATHACSAAALSCVSTVPGDEPVWQQLLRDYSNYSDAELAQEVAAKLADVRLEG